jgi:HEAT repeat protein
MHIPSAHNIVPITAFRPHEERRSQREGRIAMRNVRNAFPLLAIVLIAWHSSVALAQVVGGGNAQTTTNADPASNTPNTEEALRGLRDRDSQVRSKTLNDLRSVPLPSPIVEALGDLLVHDTCSTNRLTAIHLLAKEYSPKRLESVSRALEDKDAYVRANAAIVLGRWGQNAASAVPKLLSALADKRNDARVDVSYHLDFAPVRYHVATAIGRIAPHGAKETLSELVRAMKDDTGGEDSSMVRIAAALAVIRIKNGDAEALEVLMDALSNSSENVCYEAASSIATAGPEGKAALKSMLKKIPGEKSPLVRSAYMDAFGSFGVRDERIVRILACALDEKGCVRDSAIRSLGRIGSLSKEALPKIEAILLSNRDLEDDCNSPQSAAVEAVVRIAEPDVAMRILRDKVGQARDGVELARDIIPHLEPRGPEAQKNREILEWLLEECRKTEKEIVETLNPASGTACPSTNAHR